MHGLKKKSTKVGAVQVPLREEGRVLWWHRAQAQLRGADGPAGPGLYRQEKGFGGSLSGEMMCSFS